MCNMRILVAAIAVMLVTATLSCPPGFVSQGNKCVCADWPDGMVTCDEDSLNASMQIGHCMTYDNETGELRAGHCFQSYYRNDSHKFYYPLPTKVSDLNDQVCGPSNREGLLCGECQNGFAVPLFVSINCINCTSVFNGWIKFIALTYLPITAIFIVIVVFAISVVSDPINSVIFYGQIMASRLINIAAIVSVVGAQGSLHYSNRMSTLVVSSLYSIWNLELFYNNIIPPFCLTNHLGDLQALALEYILAFYPLIVIIFLYICIQLHARNFRPIVCCWKPFLKCFIRFRRSIDPKTSVIDAFATFTLLSYVKLVFIAGSFLIPAYLYNGQGERLNTLVLDYNANIFFHSKHLPFALLSIFISLTFIAVPPIVLTFYQASFFQKCLTQCKMNSQALRTFVETFQGCYKDGTNGTRDCRYFAGLYFILRIIAVLLTSTTIPNYMVGSAFLYWCTALLFALVQPYKMHIYNVVDGIIFALMGAIFFLVVLISIKVLITGYPSTSLLILTDVLNALPLLYFILFTMCWSLNRKTNCVQKLKSYKLLQCFFQDQKESEMEGIPHRLLNPELYNTLTDGSQAGYQEPLRADNSNTGTIYGSM